MFVAFGPTHSAATVGGIFVAIGFPITMLGGVLIMWLNIGNFYSQFSKKWEREVDFRC